MHDVGDKDVRLVAAEEIKNAWPEVELLKTSGLGHRRVLKDPQVIDEVVRFVSRSK